MPIPAPPLFVRVELVRFGPPVTAVWCDQCLLPSASAQSFAAVTGLSVVGLFKVTVCEDCGRYDSVKLREGVR